MNEIYLFQTIKWIKTQKKPTTAKCKNKTTNQLQKHNKCINKNIIKLFNIEKNI